MLTACGSQSSNSTPGGNPAVSLNQTAVSLAPGQTMQFTASVQNLTPGTVTWSVDGIAGGNTSVGTVTTSGLYNAPSTLGTHKVTATSAADTSRSASATVTVGSLSLTPTSASLQPSGTLQFSATVSGFANTSVTWSVDSVAGGNSTVGTINSAGLYSAPASAGAHTVTAASVADPTATASAMVEVSSVSVSPVSASLSPGSTQQFSASISGTVANAVSWSVDGVAGGNSTTGKISAAGLYTAPSAAGSHTVTATSLTNATLTGNASVSVITVAVSPASATIGGNMTAQFTATVQGSSDTSVTWSVDGVTGGNSTVGTISSAGLYTAPAKAGSHTVTANASAGSAFSANSAVNIFTVAVSPAFFVVNPSSTQQFTATVQGITYTAVTWSVDGVVGGNSTTGTISASGLYTAPAAMGPHTITVASVPYPAEEASAALTVVNVAKSAVLTYHNDEARDGAYLDEVTLTPANVNSTQFGKLVSYPVDGQIYAQPLYLPHVTLNGGLHDVVYVATQNNTVYAFDADATASTPATFWQKNFGPNVPKGDQEGVNPSVGILATPVIDSTTNTIYVVAEVANTPNNQPFQLHALDVATGLDKAGSPVTITGSVSGTGLDSSGGTITLEPDCYQRMGLALNPVTNAIYIAFGSCNHGWVFAYNKASLAQIAVFNDTPDSGGGAFWASGGSPAIDDISGNVFLMSGVDTIDVPYITPPPTYSQSGYNDAFLNLNPSTLAPQSYFSPDNNYNLAVDDTDLGSGSAILVPGNSQHSLETIGAGKDGIIFVLDPLNMGGFTSTNNVLQSVQTGNGSTNNNIFSTPVYWNGSLYYHSANDVLRAFGWSPSAPSGQQLSTTPTSVSSIVYGSNSTTQAHGAIASLSANGLTNGIVWDADNIAYTKDNPSGSGPLVLHAYDATNVATELYNSSQASGGRDTAGLALKFTVPTIANGRVYVPTANELDIYGLLP